MSRLIDRCNDPVDEPDREQQATSIAAAALTFEKAARELHGELKPGWKNAKHAAQWISTLERYFFPKPGNTKLDAVTPSNCVDVLRPIWIDQAEVASACTRLCNGRGHKVMSRRTR